MLENPGELVTREELAKYLWPDSHVLFDKSLNTAVNALRRVLNDPPRNPRFIETRTGIGYRFIAPVERASEQTSLLPDERHSIAVLPFENSTTNPEVNYVADGLAESLLAALSTCDGLRVTARSSAWRFRGPDVDPQEAGRRLQVGAVVTGRVLDQNQALSIGVELVDVRSGRRLWGEQYRRRPGETLGIDLEIAAQVSAKLGVTFRGGTSRIRNFDAYQDYSKGRYFYNKMTEEDLRKSVAYFESALTAEPHCALCYAGLADTYCLFAMLGMLPAHEALRLAGGYAQKALELDEQLADTHVSVAQIRKFRDRDWPAAENHYRKALDLNPNSARARYLYANYLSAASRPLEALEQVHLALELDPLSLVINNEAAWQRYMARDYQGAVEQAWRTLAMEPRFAPAQHTLGLAYEQLGMLEEAMVEFRNARACSGDHPVTWSAFAHACARAGERAQAQEVLQQLLQLSEDRYVSAYWIALVETGLGDSEGALQSLEEACQEHDPWLLWLKVEPRFDVLRQDARFQALLRRCGL